jgi:hypothetical protein
LSIEVRLLLQSNSEETKQISFLQHYKRKAVESKAKIQPFATEGSNGSYKRGAYRGNRNKKNSLQGHIAELGKASTNMNTEVQNRVETILLQKRKIRGAQSKDICDCKRTKWRA